jgi:hypothetical protein
LKIDQKTGGFSGIVSRLGRQLPRPDEDHGHVVVEPRTVAAPVSSDTVYASKTLARFLDLLFARPAAEVVDLGPVIGQNITFLGERVGCKIHVEDLFSDIDRHVQSDKLDQLPAFIGGRFSVPTSSIDAVLGWDVFDYLAPMAATALASELMRML